MSTETFNPGEWECIRCCCPGDEESLVTFGSIGSSTTRVCKDLSACVMRQVDIHRMTVGEKEARIHFRKGKVAA